jgi:hypothetical protein
MTFIDSVALHKVEVELERLTVAVENLKNPPHIEIDRLDISLDRNVTDYQRLIGSEEIKYIGSTYIDTIVDLRLKSLNKDAFKRFQVGTFFDLNINGVDYTLQIVQHNMESFRPENLFVFNMTCLVKDKFEVELK